MQYIQLGKSGFQVSRFGMGCMRFPQIEADDGSTQVDEKEAIRMIRHAIDSGVTYFDTAYGYHGGQSEVILGKALLDGYQEKVRIATKLPPTKYDEPEACFEEQLSRLQTDHLDIFLLHGLRKDRWERVKELKLLDFLDELKTDGRIDCAGFSFHDGADLFNEIIDARDWDLCQIQFNYVDVDYQAGMQGLMRAAAKGIPVVAMEPLKGGLLAQNVPDDIMAIWQQADQQKTAADWGLRWLGNMPQVTVVLSGVSSMAQLDENITIFSEPLTGCLSQAEADSISKVKQLYDEKIKVGCTACQYCMPCSSGVNIPGVFQQYNNVSIGGSLDLYKQRYGNMVENQSDASQCTECGECEEVCPQNLQIIDLLKGADALLGN